MSYEYGSCLYPSCSKMLRALADEYLYPTEAARMAGKPTDVTAAQLAAEVIEGWGLDQRLNGDPDCPSHMEKNDYSKADLADAFEDVLNDDEAVAD